MADTAAERTAAGLTSLLRDLLTDCRILRDLPAEQRDGFIDIHLIAPISNALRPLIGQQIMDEYSATIPKATEDTEFRVGKSGKAARRCQNGR